MRKLRLDKSQMSDAAYIDQAVTWSKDLTRMKARGPGDLDNAMHRIEREYGVDYWTLWTLRYQRQRLKDIGTSVYFRLRDAYKAECERQMRKMRDEIEITKAITGPADPVVLAATAVAETDDDKR